MIALQLGIGALNDVVDAPRDAGHKPGKPIPSGLVSRSTGRTIAIIAFGIGLLLASPSGAAIAGLAAVVIAIGALYDLRLKGTPWSWLPFALGIPLLPVFGWLGATGELPSFFGILMPVAVAAGAGLAIANSLVDVDRDRDAGVTSIAVALGDDRASAILIVVFGGIAIAATGSAITMRGDAIAGAVLCLLGSVPVVAAALARSQGPVVRERAWRIEACGLALLALAWIRVVV
jgi:4-hydroxybenzoate polyprenyltransferase